MWATLPPFFHDGKVPVWIFQSPQNQRAAFLIFFDWNCCQKENKVNKREKEKKGEKNELFFHRTVFVWKFQKAPNVFAVASRCQSAEWPSESTRWALAPKFEKKGFTIFHRKKSWLSMHKWEGFWFLIPSKNLQLNDFPLRSRTGLCFFQGRFCRTACHNSIPWG